MLFLVSASASLADRPLCSVLVVCQLLAGHPGGQLDCCTAYGVCLKTSVQFFLNFHLHMRLCLAGG